jgi:hypothetical protein
VQQHFSVALLTRKSHHTIMVPSAVATPPLLLQQIDTAVVWFISYFLLLAMRMLRTVTASAYIGCNIPVSTAVCWCLAAAAEFGW